MNKSETVVATAAVCAGLVATGHSVDRRHGSKPIATTAGLGLGVAYLAGTYLQNLPLFGVVARPRVADGERRFALTFDDGPDPRHTPAISSLLAERGHSATFFALGRAARAHPSLIRQLVADGHEIACHGDDHRLLAFAPPRTIVQQIVAWEEAVETALGFAGARLIRTPHGVRSPWLVAVARRRGYAVCGWDGSVFDTAEPGVETIARRVTSLLRPGAVVLLHDGDGSGGGGYRGQTVAAIGHVLDAAERQGLRSCTLGSVLLRSASASPVTSSRERDEGRSAQAAVCQVGR